MTDQGYILLLICKSMLVPQVCQYYNEMLTSWFLLTFLYCFMLKFAVKLQSMLQVGGGIECGN
jgi:hypothetical protein